MRAPEPPSIAMIWQGALRLFPPLAVVPRFFAGSNPISTLASRVNARLMVLAKVNGPVAVFGFPGTGLRNWLLTAPEREAAAGREHGPRGSSARGGHLVLRRLHRGLDVSGRHGRARGCLREQAVDGV